MRSWTSFALGIAILGALLGGCTEGGESSRTQAEWIGIAVDGKSTNGSSPGNAVFVAGEDSLVGKVDTAPVYFPALQRLGKNFAYPDRESVVLVDRNLSEIKRFRVAPLGLGTQAGAYTSPNSKNLMWSFNVGTGSEPYRRQVLTVSEGRVGIAERPNDLLGPRVCDDGSARWLEFREDNSALSYVEFANGNIVKEVALSTPQGLKLVEDSVAIDCETTEIYVAGQNDGEAVQYFRSQALKSDQSGADKSWEKVGKPIRFPQQGVNRSIIHSGKDLIIWTVDQGIASVDYRNGEVTLSQRLIPDDEVAISVTQDRDRLNVVTQSDSGGLQLKVHSFSIRSLELEHSSVLLEDASLLFKQGGIFNSTYAIPLYVYSLAQS